MILVVFNGCEDGISGEEFENQPPTTNLTVNEINLPEGQRLSSRVNISWWGNDPDGFIAGFEIAINDTSEDAFTFTTATDSIFILPIESGQSTDDVLFKVRAVDNDSLRDPVGASLVFPIVNTPPTVEFNFAELPPDTTFTFASLGWTVDDPDGLVSLDRTEISFNDSTDQANWQEIPLPDDEEEEGRIFVTIDINNDATDNAEGAVFLGRGFLSTNLTVDNILLDQENTVYIRTIDQSGAVSELDSHTWFIRRQTSKVLYLNDHDGNDALEAQAFHLQQLAANGITPDVLDISDGQATGGDKVRLSEGFPAVIDPTLRKMLDKWDHIYWVSNNLDRNITFAENILTEFINNGGSIFINIPTRTGFNPSDPLFNFIPVGDIARLEGLERNFRIPNGEEVFSDDSTFPALRATQTISGIAPIDAIAGSDNLYEADFKAQLTTGFVVEYDDFEGVAVRSSEGNLIYFAVDLLQLNGNNNMADFIRRVVIEELGFEQ